MDLHIPAMDAFAMDQQRSRQAAVVPFKTEDIKDVHESSKMTKNRSIDDFWMLVNNGDLPKPEQNVLSQQLNTLAQMNATPKGALQLSKLQSPPSSSSSSSSSSFNHHRHQQSVPSQYPHASSSSSSKGSNQQQHHHQHRIDHHTELNELLTIEDMKECITGVISSSRLDSRRAAAAAAAALGHNTNTTQSRNNNNNSTNNIIITNNNNNDNNHSNSIHSSSKSSSNSSNNNNSNTVNRVVSVKREYDADPNNYFNPDCKEGDDEDDDNYILDQPMEQIVKKFKY